MPTSKIHVRAKNWLLLAPLSAYLHLIFLTYLLISSMIFLEYRWSKRVKLAGFKFGMSCVSYFGIAWETKLQKEGAR